ncbi:MAG: helix-turn-helix transcriptional regulator [Vicinamibacterales bacterium]
MSSRVSPAPRQPPSSFSALFQARTVASFVPAVASFVRDVVRCDFVSVLYRSSGDAMLREHDSRGRTYGADFMRRYAALTPAVPLVLANPGIKVLPTRSGLPNRTRELRRTEFYREVMKPQGWRHAVALCFWGEATPFPVMVITLNREEGRPDFSRADIARLDATHPVLDAAVARLLERSASRTIVGALALTLRHLSHGLLVLDARRRVVFTNHVARRRCVEWMAGSSRSATAPGRARVPPMLLAVCDELHGQWRSQLRQNGALPAKPPTRQISFSVGTQRHAAKVVLDLRTWARGGEPTFVVEFFDESASAGPVAPIRRRVLTALLPMLTAAEREVAAVAADGLSNQEIADRLGKSVGAVKFLLHRVYQKAGISSRSMLVALLRSRRVSGPGRARVG